MSKELIERLYDEAQDNTESLEWKAADLLEAQQKRIEELTAERNEFAGYAKDGTVIAAQQQNRIQHLEFALADTEALELGTAEKLAASQAQIKVLRDALKQCREAFEFTRQYVGYETLPAIEGWSWFDADTKAKAALAQPTDDSALRELLKAERERCAKVCMKQCSVIEEPHEFERCAEAIRAMEDQ